MYVILLFAIRKNSILNLQNAKRTGVQPGSKGGIVMIDKTKIKVVKKTDAGVAKIRVKKAPTQRASAREMVSTVTDWVTEIKQRKSDETKAAFDLLFAANRQPNES